MRYIDYNKLDDFKRPIEPGDYIYMMTPYKTILRDCSTYQEPHFTEAIVMKVQRSEEVAEDGSRTDLWLVDDEGCMRKYRAYTYQVWLDENKLLMIIPKTKHNTYELLKWYREEDQRKFYDMIDTNTVLQNVNYDLLKVVSNLLQDVNTEDAQLKILKNINKISELLDKFLVK